MLCGIFIGGRAQRMGGEPKGLLSAPTGEPIVVRLACIARDVGLTPVWVGLRDSPHAELYRAALPDLRELDDRPRGIGPLGGLAGLLAAGDAPVLALACDLPRVSPQLLTRLMHEHAQADVLAPREQFWQPLCARYAPRIAPQVERAIASGTRSFQRLFDALEVQALALSAHERVLLRDWDTPEDVR